MALLAQERSLRSPQINFRQLDDQTEARLRMADGSSFYVRKDGHRLLRVRTMPMLFRIEVFEKLSTGQGFHDQVTGAQLERMVFRLPYNIKIGDKIWMQSFMGDKFFRVFHFPVEVVEATAQPLAGRIPHQR